MKRTLSISAFCFLFSALCFGQFNFTDLAFQPQPVASAPAATYLLNQNFEGTDYDNSESWTETRNAGTVDEDYTTTVLAGSQSLLMTDAAFGLCTTVSPSWSAQTITYGYFMYRMAARPVSATSIAVLRSSASARVTIQIISSGAIRIYGDIGGTGTAATTVSAMNGATTYHVWWSCDATSSPETVTIAFSNDGIRPTSGNNFASATSDTTSTSNNLLLQPVYTSNDTIFDRVLVDDVQIGNNP